MSLRTCFGFLLYKMYDLSLSYPLALIMAFLACLSVIAYFNYVSNERQPQSSTPEQCNGIVKSNLQSFSNINGNNVTRSRTAVSSKSSNFNNLQNPALSRAIENARQEKRKNNYTKICSEKFLPDNLSVNYAEHFEEKSFFHKVSVEIKLLNIDAVVSSDTQNVTDAIEPVGNCGADGIQVENYEFSNSPIGYDPSTNATSTDSSAANVKTKLTDCQLSSFNSQIAHHTVNQPTAASGSKTTVFAVNGTASQPSSFDHSQTVNHSVYQPTASSSRSPDPFVKYTVNGSNVAECLQTGHITVCQPHSFSGLTNTEFPVNIEFPVNDTHSEQSTSCDQVQMILENDTNKQPKSEAPTQAAAVSIEKGKDAIEWERRQISFNDITDEYQNNPMNNIPGTSHLKAVSDETVNHKEISISKDTNISPSLTGTTTKSSVNIGIVDKLKSTIKKKSSGKNIIQRLFDNNKNHKKGKKTSGVENIELFESSNEPIAMNDVSKSLKINCESNSNASVRTGTIPKIRKDFQIGEKEKKEKGTSPKQCFVLSNEENKEMPNKTASSSTVPSCNEVVSEEIRNFQHHAKTIAIDGNKKPLVGSVNSGCYSKNKESVYDEHGKLTLHIPEEVIDKALLHMQNQDIAITLDNCVAKLYEMVQKGKESEEGFCPQNENSGSPESGSALNKQLSLNDITEKRFNNIDLKIRKLLQQIQVTTVNTELNYFNSESNDLNTEASDELTSGNNEENDELNNEENVELSNDNPLQHSNEIKMNRAEKIFLNIKKGISNIVPKKVKSIYRFCCQPFMSNTENNHENKINSDNITESSTEIGNPAADEMGIYGEITTEIVNSAAEERGAESDLPVGSPVPELDLCVGCIENFANSVYFPCGHSFLCIDCASEIFQIYKKCYVCNEVIDSVHRLKC